MPRMYVKPRPFRRPGALAALLTLAAALVAAPASAQVVVVANGSPITKFDIEQRTKLLATSSKKRPSRKEVIQQLIDDRLKIAKAKSYGFAVPDDAVEQAFAQLAARQHVTLEQFLTFIKRAGIAPATIKARIRADLTWNQLIRSKYSSSLQVGESDIANALRERNETSVVGYIYTLYPVTIVIPAGSGNATVKTKLREAENLRSRFTSCKSGLDFARAMRDVAVREPITRSSGSLPEKFRELLGGMPLGRLTAPERTAQGLEMFAVCEKKESRMDSPVQHKLRAELQTQRFNRESEKYLDEIRKSAMIEYK